MRAEVPFIVAFQSAAALEVPPQRRLLLRQTTYPDVRKTTNAGEELEPASNPFRDCLCHNGRSPQNVPISKKRWGKTDPLLVPCPPFPVPFPNVTFSRIAPQNQTAQIAERAEPVNRPPKCAGPPKIEDQYRRPKSRT